MRCVGTGGSGRYHENTANRLIGIHTNVNFRVE